MLCGWKIDETSSGTFSVVQFGICNGEPYGSVTTPLVHTYYIIV
jgi:hypothetical protein